MAHLHFDNLPNLASARPVMLSANPRLPDVNQIWRE